MLTGKGYTNGFLSYNIRATNEYRKRTCLAYCVNVFFNPFMKNYFLAYGVEVQEDVYALSEMIQWIWRSAIRDGEEIWVYIASTDRAVTRLLNVLLELSNEAQQLEFLHTVRSEYYKREANSLLKDFN